MALIGTWTPRLGLDLQGGTSVILTPKATQAGAKVDSGAVNQAVDIIRQRVDGLGVAESEVKKAGSQIEISVPGRGRNDVVDLVGQTAELRFREVADLAAATPAPAPTAPATAAAPTATPTTGSTLAPSGAPATPSPTATSRPDAVGSGLLAQAAPTPTPTPTTQPTASAAAAATTPAAAATTPAAAATTPAAAATTPAAADPTAAASADTPPAAVQAKYDALTCTPEQVAQGAGGADAPTDWVAACGRDGTTKYLLKPASVVGTDVKSASAGLMSSGGTTNVSTGQWMVNVNFTGSGQSKFTKLTEATIGKQVAIVLDGVVQSAPSTDERISGSAQISGSFTQSEAQDLANVLRYGALPLAFEKSQAESISPTLGREALRGGLLAGAIGLALVVIYAFIYYRAMGLVVISSLAVSAILIYASVALLGDAIGFTLSLAGIAGLILSIGVTADSFVVYFERIKDEVRENRTVRAAVERAWPPARRTMLSADTVSFLAAAVLYIVSVGSVRGFAFTLGLSTLIDVFIMFVFTRPLVTLLVRRRLFASPRWSGLGSVGGGRLVAADAPRRRLARRAGPAQLDEPDPQLAGPGRKRES
jgi:preprotein translocase subunit SecD